MLLNEALEGNEEHVIGHWRKGSSCYKVAENLNCVQPLGELITDELGYLTEEISKQSVEMWLSFSLVFMNMRRGKLRIELLSKKEPHLMIWKILCLSKQHALETGPRVRLDHHLLDSSTQSNTSEARNRDMVIQERSVEDPLVRWFGHQ